MKKELKIIRIKEKREKVTDKIVEELPLTIFINGEELATLLCSPSDIKYLVYGFLYNEGIIKAIRDIKELKINKERGLVSVELKEEDKIKGIKGTFQRRVITSGCSGFYNAADLKIKKIKSGFRIKKEKINELMLELMKKSAVFRETGGVHSSALCDNKKIIFFSEDIGRHNTIDKIIGKSLEKRINLKNKMVLTSGRLSSEMILKAAKQQIPVIASKGAPTELAIKLAKNIGITLVGFVRGKRINVYCNEKRIL